MASNINLDNIDPTLPAESSGVNVGKVLKQTFINALTAIKTALTVTKTEIESLQTLTTNLQAAINAVGGGTAGSIWRVTSGAPASSLGINGDFALNSVNGDVYQKAAGAYTVVANIKGSAGAAGAQGAQGPQGNAGAAGAAGRGITGIARTSGTGAAGTTDTYTITFSDTTTTTFTVTNGANGTGGGGGSVAAPVYTADITASRALAAADLSSNAAPVLLIYNSATNGVLTIPTDATLGLSGLSNAEIVVYQKGTGRIDVAAGSGVTISNYAGAPTSLQYVTQRFHRVGANTWSMQ